LTPIPWAQPTVDNSNGALSFIRSPNYNHARIVYNNGNISVYVNNTLYLTGFQTFNFSGYLGFTAATGAKDDNHSVKNVIIYTDMPASEAGPDQKVCSGTAVQLGVAPDAANLYTWQVSVVATPPAPVPPATANPIVTLSNTTGQTVSYKYVVGTAYATAPGCASFDSVVVTVLPAKLVDPSIQPVNICNGGSYQLLSGKVVSVTGPVQDILKNGLGCDSLINYYSVTDVGIINNDTTVCKGTSFPLHGKDALTWQWAPAHGLSSTTVQDPVLQADSALTYSLVSTAVAGNLAANGDFELGNMGFYTNYLNCNTNNCLFPFANDGYSVGTDANFYHTLFTGHDHTTGKGNFLIINGADPSRTVWKETIPVQPNTTYAFGCWISTMITVSPAQIRFSINGVQLGPIYNAPARVNEWDRFFITWNPGASKTATIEIVDVLNISNGNDFGLDDIFFGQVISCTDRVKVGLTPPPSAHLAGQSAGVCAGGTAVFTALPVGAGNRLSYQWQLNGVNAGMNASTYSYSSPVNGDRVNCILTDPDACPGNQVIHSDTFSVAVAAPVTPAVTITTASSTICTGADMTLTAAATNGGGAASIQWMVNSVVRGSGYTFTAPAPADGDVISCLLVSSLPCTAPVASNVVVVRLQPAVAASLQITASAGVVCSDSVVVFTASPVNGGDYPLYQWQLNGKATGGTGPVYSASHWNNGDVIGCILTSSLSCTVSVPAANTITMNVLPSPEILQMPPDEIIAAGSSVVLSPLISGNGLHYSWSPSDGLSDAAVAAPVASPSIPTVYRLTVTAGDGCTATGKVVIGVFRSLQMPNAFTPNGDGRNDVFRIPAIISLKINGFLVYNRQGNLLFSTRDATKGWDGRYGARLQPAGTYIWAIEYDNPLIKSSVRQSGTVELVR